MNRLKFADDRSIEPRDEAPNLYRLYRRLMTSQRYTTVIDRKVRTRCDECLETFQKEDTRVIVSPIVEMKKKRKLRFHEACLKSKIFNMEEALKVCDYRPLVNYTDFLIQALKDDK